MAKSKCCNAQITDLSYDGIKVYLCRACEKYCSLKKESKQETIKRKKKQFI